MDPQPEHDLLLHPAGLIRAPRRFWPAVWITLASITTYAIVLVVILERTSDDHPSIDGNGLLPQDVWPSLLVAVIVQAGATGLLLALSKANRQIGLGMFWGSIGAFGDLALCFAGLALTMTS